MSSDTYVVIRSAKQPTRYVTVNGKDLTVYMPSGAGRVWNEKSPDSFTDGAVFKLERCSDGTVGFQSAIWPNVYLRMDASDGLADNDDGDGFGCVNLQFGMHAYEKFNLVSANVITPPLHSTIIFIESHAFPGNYVRLSIPDDVVNVQEVQEEWEQLELIVVTQGPWVDHVGPKVE